MQVGFRVSPDLLAYVDHLEPQTEPDVEDEVALEVNNAERKLHFRHHMLVEFNNNTSQVCLHTNTHKENKK